MGGKPGLSFPSEYVQICQTFFTDFSGFFSVLHFWAFSTSIVADQGSVSSNSPSLKSRFSSSRVCPHDGNFGVCGMFCYGYTRKIIHFT